MSWRAWLLWLAAVCAPVGAQVPVEDFARTDWYDSASISPDGSYLALRAPMGTDFGLLVVNLADPKRGGTKLTAGADRSILDYYWAGPKRLVFGIAENFGFASQPAATGEIYSVDADGKRGRLIFSWRGEVVPTGTRLGRNIRKDAIGSVVRTLPEDPEHIIVASYNVNLNITEDRLRAVAMRVHTHSGKRDRGVEAPIYGWVEFGADRSGFVRYAVGTDEKGYSLTYVRSPEQPQWRLLSSGKRDGATVQPVEFSPDNRWVYLRSNEETGRHCLLREDLTTGARSTLSCDDVADAASVVLSPDGQEPAAVLYQAGKPRLHILDPSSSAGAVLKIVQKAFPGQVAVPVSSTLDGRKLVLLVSSDRNPGDYYLVDVASRKADYIAGRYKWIDPEQMAERRPIVVQARDGQALHGYLTLPKGVEPSKLPLVVHPHGGPLGVQDTWDWAPDPQLLASRGYAVLQINFRGSGGFGVGFEYAGRRGWDTVMIDDISDAARWAVAQGYADPQRLCIYGASYGGFAALMSAEREPELYRCAVGYSGVYDLPLLRRDSYFSHSRRGRNFIEEFIGATPEELLRASPVAHVDKLKAAVLIVHGTQDKRTPLSQAESLRAALEARQYPYEWMEVAGEGHGFYAPENRRAFYEKLLAFLDRNIGKPAPPALATK